MNGTDRENLLARFWAKVNKTDTCWLWMGSTSNGYGCVCAVDDGRRTTYRAHRVAYEAMVGPISSGMELDHLCRLRSCVNPAHLEPVTHAENCRRERVSNNRSVRKDRKAAQRAYHARRDNEPMGVVCSGCGSGFVGTRLQFLRSMRGVRVLCSRLCPGANRKRSHCARGHALTPENRVVCNRGRATRCRACKSQARGKRIVEAEYGVRVVELATPEEANVIQVESKS